MMKDLKLKVELLENSIQYNLKALTEQKNTVIAKIQRLKKTILVSEVLAAGFFIGYMLLPGKKSAMHFRRNSLALIFLKAKRIIQKLKS